MKAVSTLILSSLAFKNVFGADGKAPSVLVTIPDEPRNSKMKSARLLWVPIPEHAHDIDDKIRKWKSDLEKENLIPIPSFETLDDTDFINKITSTASTSPDVDLYQIPDSDDKPWKTTAAATNPPTINDYDGPCDSTTQCSPNSFCEDYTHINPKTGIKQNTYCVPRYTLNEDCHNNHDDNHDTCQGSNLYCDYEGTGKCMTKKDFNSPCTEDHHYECKSGVCSYDNLDQDNHWKCARFKFPETCEVVTVKDNDGMPKRTSICNQGNGFCNDQGKCELRRPNLTTNWYERECDYTYKENAHIETRKCTHPSRCEYNHECMSGFCGPIPNGQFCVNTLNVMTEICQHKQCRNPNSVSLYGR